MKRLHLHFFVAAVYAAVFSIGHLGIHGPFADYLQRVNDQKNLPWSLFHIFCLVMFYYLSLLTLTFVVKVIAKKLFNKDLR